MCNLVMLNSPPAFVDPAVQSAVKAPPQQAQPFATIPQLPQVLLEQVPAALPRSERFVRRLSGVSFESEAFRLQTQRKISELEHVAASTAESSGTNALLAKKALKFRRVQERRTRAAAKAQC